MTTKQTRLLALLALVLAAGAYFHFDVGRRARIDRGAKYHRTDFTVYQYAARALNAGEDPYEARNPRGYRYVYPPLLSVLLMPIADWKPPHAALVFFVLSMLALVGTVLALRTLVPSWLPIIAAAVVCLGFAHQGFQRGQVTHILLYLQVAALACLLGRHFVWAGVLLGLGGALRLTPLLPAAAVGLGLLVAAFRGTGARAPLRFGLGLAGGLVLGFVLIPLAFLGPSRAHEVTERWVEVTQDVYGQNVDLDGDYSINEWRFKNQAPRRVYGTWAGWLQDLPFDKERPQLAKGQVDDLDRNAAITSVLFLLLAIAIGATHLREPGAPRFAFFYALVVLLPVLMTRYTWPTHYLMAAPALVFAARSRTLPVLVLFAGTALFYAAHWKPLQVVGEAGCLMLACLMFVALLLLRPEPEADTSHIGGRYSDGGWKNRAYRAARLRAGGFGRLAALLPEEGLVVDLGCGMGLFGHVLIEGHPKRRVLAVDHDAARVRQLTASAEGLPIEVRCADMASTEIPACAGVALVDVLHYLDADTQEALLRRAAAALEPGGVLLLRDPDRAARIRFPLARLHEKIALATGFTKAGRGRYRGGTEWVDLLTALGLEARTLPLGCSPYPDRIVVGVKP